MRLDTIDQFVHMEKYNGDDDGDEDRDDDIKIIVHRNMICTDDIEQVRHLFNRLDNMHLDEKGCPGCEDW